MLEMSGPVLERGSLLIVFFHTNRVLMPHILTLPPPCFTEGLQIFQAGEHREELAVSFGFLTENWSPPPSPGPPGENIILLSITIWNMFRFKT